MANQMRRDPPSVERRHSLGAAPDKPVDAEPRISPSMPAEEYGIHGGPSAYQLHQRTFGTWPQRTLSDLSALAVERDQGVSAVASSDTQIVDCQLRCFGDACPGVVEKQKHAVLDPALMRAPVGHLEQRLHLGLAEPADRLRGGLLQGDGTDIGAPLQKRRVATGDESGEGADGRQALIAGGHGAAALGFQIGEKLKHARGCQVAQREAVDRLAGLGADERQQQGEGVPVALLRVGGEVALGDDVFGQEAAQPRAECLGITHGLLH